MGVKGDSRGGLGTPRHLALGRSCLIPKADEGCSQDGKGSTLNTRITFGGIFSQPACFLTQDCGSIYPDGRRQTWGWAKDLRIVDFEHLHKGAHTLQQGRRIDTK